jgi:hypothetical protein
VYESIKSVVMASSKAPRNVMADLAALLLATSSHPTPFVVSLLVHVMSPKHALDPLPHVPSTDTSPLALPVAPLPDPVMSQRLVQGTLLNALPTSSSQLAPFVVLPLGTVMSPSTALDRLPGALLIDTLLELKSAVVQLATAMSPRLALASHATVLLTRSRMLGQSAVVGLDAVMLPRLATESPRNVPGKMPSFQPDQSVVVLPEIVMNPKCVTANLTTVLQMSM